jgi:hypothetical protein
MVVKMSILWLCVQWWWWLWCFLNKIYASEILERKELRTETHENVNNNNNNNDKSKNNDDYTNSLIPNLLLIFTFCETVILFEAAGSIPSQPQKGAV